MSEKPILFSGPMVRAILDNRKSQTRRVVKPQPPSECSIHYMLGNESWLPETDRTPLRHHWEAWAGPLFDNRPDGHLAGGVTSRCPYGAPGDLLWVKETWRPGGFDPSADWMAYQIFYRADGAARSMPFDPGCDKEPKPNGRKWRPSIFMPRWASRLTLRVTRIRVERLQEISAADAIAEGIVPGVYCENHCTWRGSEDDLVADIDGEDPHCPECGSSDAVLDELPEQAFARGWDSINAKPKPIYRDKKIVSYVSYPWENINEMREHRGKPWNVVGNPWVRAVTFKREVL